MFRFIFACRTITRPASRRKREGGIALAGEGAGRNDDPTVRAHGAAPSEIAGRMSEPTPRFWNVFFEVYEALPRQGPGNRLCAARALRLCDDLPPAPAVLDLGCGVGGQTLHLAEFTSGPIVAIDSHAPSIARLNATLNARGLSGRVRALVGDMAHPAQPPESFDLIWSEGALYNIGIENALQICRGLLRPGGHLAFTDAVWRKQDPPPEVKASFDLDYPAMGWADDVVAAIERGGFEPRGRFTLPDEAWWDDFYTPMQRRIEESRGKYADDTEALAVLDQLAQEPEMHRRYSDYYAYEFFVARRPPNR
jgi:SAM-dependent methyltransferase